LFSIPENHHPPSQAKKVQKMKPFEQIPLRKGLLPIFKTGFCVMTGQNPLNEYHKLLVAEVKKHGPIFRVGNTVFTANPRDWEVIFKSLRSTDQADRSILWSTRYYNTIKNLPLGYSDLEGEEFYKRREWMGKNILQPSIIGKVVPKYSAVTDDLLKILEGVLETSESIVVENFIQFIVRWQFECGGMLTFDKRLRALSLDPDFVPEKAVYNLMIGSKTFFKHFPNLEFGSPIHRTALTRRWKEYEESNDLIYDASRELLEKYELKIIENFENVPPEVQTAIVADLMRASAETVSIVLLWLTIELGRNPEAQQRIYEEVNPVLSKEPVITEKVLQKQHYTRAFIKEVFRVRSPLCFSAKKLLSDIQLDSGYELPAGKDCILLMGQYNQDDYFDDASEFKPERWLNNRTTPDSVCPFNHKKPIPKFASTPFGYGPRACTGRRVAERLLAVYLMKMVNKFVIHPPAKEYAGEYHLFYQPEGQVDVHLEVRR
jgi:Cytochrome P450